MVEAFIKSRAVVLQVSYLYMFSGSPLEDTAWNF